MIPISLLGDGSLVQAALTLIVALVPAALAWWTDRRLLTKRDDPALPELLANRRRAHVRSIAIAAALMLVLGGGDAGWGIPLLIASMIAAAYPLRTHLLGETWGFGAYLWNTMVSAVGSYGFWIALAYVPILVRWYATGIGVERWWLVGMLSLLLIAVLFVWEAWYPRVWLWSHGGEPLVSPELTPRFEEIIRRAATVSPQVYRIGSKGSRFVNAVALPSVRQPSVAIGTALLELLDADETAAIFAHEIAHFDHFTPRRVRRSQLLNRALIVTSVLLALAATFTSAAWGPLLGWVWPILLLVALVRRAAKSQQHETDSDLRAAALCGDPEALVRGLVKLHLHARIPRRYAVDIERAASHPSLVRRIQAIRAGGAAAIEQLGAATVIRSTREGSWVVLDEARSYWLDGVPDGTTAELAALREAASSYRAVNYRDLVELRVSATGEARSIAARTRSGDAWSVPLAMDDVARVQGALDVVDLRLGKAGPASVRVAPKLVAIMAFAVSVLAGQTGLVLVPIFIVLSKPAPAALAALGAMSIMRAVLGALEGSTWLDAEIVRLGLASMVVVGGAAIYLAVRLVRAGHTRDHLRLTMSALAAMTALVAVAVLWQFIQAPKVPVAGSPIVGALGTALIGLAAGLLTTRARWSRPAGYGGLAVAVAVAALGVDRAAVTLRRALKEETATATLVFETDLRGPAGGLRVSPSGTRFLARQSPIGRRATVASAQLLLVGKVGGAVREVSGSSGDFVDDDHILVLDALERGVELRLESVEGGSPPAWVDTIADLSLVDPRVTLERDTRRWAVVGEDADNDRTAVMMGRIGEKRSMRRASIPDTIAVVGEPIVFGATEMVIVPSFTNSPRGRSLSLWTMFSGWDAIHTDLWGVRGDSIQRVASLRGAPQCGDPLGGAATCVVRRAGGTALYGVSARGEATEVAEVASQDLGVVTVGPGLHVTSMTFQRAIVVIDLAARRLTRIPLPPNSQFAAEVRAGPGWIVTLGMAENRRSKIRYYRVQGTR